MSKKTTMVALGMVLISALIRAETPQDLNWVGKQVSVEGPENQSPCKPEGQDQTCAALSQKDIEEAAIRVRDAFTFWQSKAPILKAPILPAPVATEETVGERIARIRKKWQDRDAEAAEAQKARTRDPVARRLTWSAAQSKVAQVQKVTSPSVSPRSALKKTGVDSPKKAGRVSFGITERFECVRN